MAELDHDDDDLDKIDDHHHLVRVYEDVHSRGEREEQMAELDHDSSPKWLVWKLTVAGG